MAEKSKCKDFDSHNFPDFGLKSVCVWCGLSVADAKPVAPAAVVPTPAADPIPIPPPPPAMAAPIQQPIPNVAPASDPVVPPKGHITLETAAREIYFWLKKAQTLGFMAMISPFVIVAVAFYNTNAAAVMAMTVCIVAVLFFKPVNSEVKRIGEKYGFVGKR